MRKSLACGAKIPHPDSGCFYFWSLRFRWIVQQTFALQYAPNFFERCLNVSLRKTDLPETLDIRKLLATFLEEHDGFGKAKSTLKQTGFMDDVHAGVYLAALELILTSHYQKRYRRRVEHF